MSNDEKEKERAKDPAYPVWRYHQEQCPDGKVVYSKAEDQKLGAGWVDSPAKFTQLKECEKAESYKEHQEQWAAKDESEASGEKPKAKPKKTKA